MIRVLPLFKELRHSLKMVQRSHVCIPTVFKNMGAAASSYYKTRPHAVTYIQLNAKVRYMCAKFSAMHNEFICSWGEGDETHLANENAGPCSAVAIIKIAFISFLQLRRNYNEATWYVQVVNPRTVPASQPDQ